MIIAAAKKISDPSTAADMYSALPWPKLWLSSAGFAASRSAQRPTMAATRFTVDSSASDHRPTEFVSQAAHPLIPTVAIAVAMESQMNLSNMRWVATDCCGEEGTGSV